MSWNVYDKVEQEEKMQQQERMTKLLEKSLQPPAPEPLVLTWEMRKAFIGEFSEHIEEHVPEPHAYIAKLTLLDYSCRKLAAEPDEDEA